ncbi:hypothetical protein RSOLAG1IB_05032 [Rhizoctonia solani AG-1 IB]|uniref:Uncharacterized protein n=1 Tax=Thanatephorus cucumeris (strain AG1-IB / isolate 7/3/14) TaxID=1108050 RepID=A0A0B7FXL2_THACB|nr:hypothetical protein RSOLAG1IB_05032 [Rhizoctonia solani AG-1 IB]
MLGFPTTISVVTNGTIVLVSAIRMVFLDFSGYQNVPMTSAVHTVFNTEDLKPQFTYFYGKTPLTQHAVLPVRNMPGMQNVLKI